VGGLATTIVVMNVFEAAQPALLYIVPAVLGAVSLHALFQGNFKQASSQTAWLKSLRGCDCFAGPSDAQEYVLHRCLIIQRTVRNRSMQTRP
jgi:hypothetical protein